MIVDALQRQSGLNRSRLLFLANSASQRYKVYTIEKRTGGQRVIEHPSRELKAIQRWLAGYLFSKFPTHKSATAYKEGASIRINALMHANSNYTLRLDFSNFFGSFSKEDVMNFLDNEKAILPYQPSDEDINFVGDISTRHGKMVIGAPSSPILSNIMMHSFDAIAFDYFKARDIIYTRYADDIFVSANDSASLQEVEPFITGQAQQHPYGKLLLNHSKTARLSKRVRRTVTGLVITPENKISIGRSKKKTIKSMIHKAINGKLNAQEIMTLQGLLSYTKGAEPEFLSCLFKKYGEADTLTIMNGKWKLPADSIEAPTF
jgi:RNA-directed DNA polymerase